MHKLLQTMQKRIITISPPPRAILCIKELREFKHGGLVKGCPTPSDEEIISLLGRAALSRNYAVQPQMAADKRG
jgi:hypothetical protein